jgi:hypothetical protein
MKIFDRHRPLALLAVTAIVACIAAVAAPSSRADYGSNSLYQIEFSANNGSGGADGATPQSGDVTNWSDDGTNLVISLVLKIGGVPKQVTFTVPDSFGHCSGPTDSYLSPDPFGGVTQLTVAP